MSRLQRLCTGALEVLFPPRCAACDALGVEPFCARCAEHLEPGGRPAVAGADWTWSEFEYGGAASEAISRFKYRGRWELARSLSVPMLRSAAVGPRFDRIVPVPTTAARWRERGYNPARELARAWGRRVDGRTVGRRPGPTQVGRTRRERSHNLRDVFFADPARVVGRDLLIVDDVITTGATATAIVDLLRRHGARRIGFIALAATPRMGPNE